MSQQTGVTNLFETESYLKDNEEYGGLLSEEYTFAVFLKIKNVMHKPHIRKLF